MDCDFEITRALFETIRSSFTLSRNSLMETPMKWKYYCWYSNVHSTFMALTQRYKGEKAGVWWVAQPSFQSASVFLSQAPYPLKLPAGRFRVLLAPGATFLNREHAGDAAGTLPSGNFFFLLIFSWFCIFWFFWTSAGWELQWIRGLSWWLVKLKYKWCTCFFIRHTSSNCKL